MLPTNDSLESNILFDLLTQTIFLNRHILVEFDPQSTVLDYSVCTYLLSRKLILSLSTVVVNGMCYTTYNKVTTHFLKEETFAVRI